MSLNEYEAAGGYMALRKALKEMTPRDVQKIVTDSNLRGRGGAGFPTGQKGTFKDRLLMEGNPHQLIEGMIISAYAIQADVSYIFLRWAYKLAAARLEKAIAEAYDNNYLGKNIIGTGYGLEMHLHTSAGRYICGEETALLNALEGKRAVPRAKPPFPQVCGLWGKPTIVNNAETISNISHIVNNGADWFKGLSLSPDAGTKIYGVSGRVKRPGAWELPMGVTIRELLEEHAGGMREGYKFRSVIPGGASTEFLMEEHLDVKMDYGSVQKAGSRLGTGAMIVIDDRTCPVGAVLNLETFFARESCGWCTPCREGLRWIEQILFAIENGEGEPEDIAVLEEQCRRLAPGNTYCVHAPGAVEPLQSGLKIFRDDFERHIRGKRCPWK